MSNRKGWKAWQWGSGPCLTVAPHKRAARRNIREEFGVPVPAADVTRYEGPWEFWNPDDGDSPFVTTEEDWVESISTYGEDIVCEGG